MLQAYIGIVSRSGIELFCPEDPGTVRFLRQRAKRRGGQAACFWSVLPEEAVSLVKAALLCGHAHVALELMQLHAREGGFMVPVDEETAQVFAAR